MMTLTEGILRRRSIRRFLPGEVPAETIRSVLETAQRSPSSLNSQPWQFFAVTGRCLERLRNENVRRVRAGDPLEVEFNSAHWSRESVYGTRQIELAKALFGAMGIERGDREKRSWWYEQGFRYFDAPAVLFLTAGSDLPENAVLFDLGIAAQTVCLAALEYGLGTCIEQQGIAYGSSVRRIAGIPDDRRLVMAIAMGYPDFDAPVNNVSVGRAGMDQTLFWRSEPAD